MSGNKPEDGSQNILVKKHDYFSKIELEYVSKEAKMQAVELWNTSFLYSFIIENCKEIVRFDSVCDPEIDSFWHLSAVYENKNAVKGGISLNLRRGESIIFIDFLNATFDPNPNKIVLGHCRMIVDGQSINPALSLRIKFHKFECLSHAFMIGDMYNAIRNVCDQSNPVSVNFDFLM